MKALEEKIMREGRVLPGNVLKVDTFLNHRIDTPFLMQMGEDIAEHFKSHGINKVLTVETSGIAIAVAAASKLNVPVVFAKKHKTTNISDNVYSAAVKSFTHQTTYTIVVSREVISKDDNILIVDDFLANGNALTGLKQIAESAGAKVAGAAIAVEKGFQHGGDMLRDNGMEIYSLATVESMNSDKGEIVFR